MPLSDRLLKTLRPAEKAQRLYDARGLYIEVSPAGSKLWRFKYRFGGKEKRLALGIYPDVTLKDARDRCDDVRRILARGTDPGAAAKVAKQALTGEGTFEVVARDWHKQQTPTWAPIHAGTVLRRLVMFAFPWIGQKLVGEVTAPELLALLRRIEKRGTIETAHRVRSICGQVFRFAIASGLAQRDPAADLRDALAPVPDRHFASVTEPDQLAPLLQIIDGYHGTDMVRCALQLQALLFVRPGELRHMKWAEVDLEGRQWRFIASKNKVPHIVPLSLQAVAQLKELQPITSDGQYVFPSERSRSRAMSNNTINAALRRCGIDTRTELTGHGWRAAARTILEEHLHFRPEIIEQQLAHTVRDPLGRAYNRTTHIEERTRMMQAWANFLDGLREKNIVNVKFKKAATK